MGNLQVWECRRFASSGDESAGALIIAAHDQDEARAIYREREGGDGYYGLPDMHLWEGVTATGAPRVLYDDMTR